MKKLKGTIIGMFFLAGLFPVISQGADKSVVYFDQGHGQLFFADRGETLDLSGLAGLFSQSGSTVRTGRDNISDKLLSSINALVISGPFNPFSPEEIERIIRFIQKGGSVSVMLHIGPPAGDLLHALGVDFTNGVVREREGVIDNEPLNFKVTHLKAHELTSGLKQFNLYGGWGVINSDDKSEVIAETGPTAWVDLNRDKRFSQGDAVQSIGVVVAGRMGGGRFVVFGDDAIFQNKFLAGDNVLLGKRLVEWMKTTGSIKPH